MVQLLLDNGAYVNARGPNGNALDIAIESSRYDRGNLHGYKKAKDMKREVIAILLERGAISEKYTVRHRKPN